MSDPVSAPATFWEWLFGGIWLVVAALFGLVYKNNERRVSALERELESKASVDDIKALRSDHETHRQEMRADVTEINQKIDTLGQQLHTQISNNQSNILSAIASLKSEK